MLPTLRPFYRLISGGLEHGTNGSFRVAAAWHRSVQLGENGRFARQAQVSARIINARVKAAMEPAAVPIESRPSEDPRGFPSQSPFASAAAVSLLEVP